MISVKHNGGFKMKLFLIILVLAPAVSSAGTDAGKGPKVKGPKILLTSTRIGGHWTPAEFKDEGDCIRMDLNVPGSRVPLPLCLKRKSGGSSMPGFHKNFTLRVTRPNGTGGKELDMNHILAQKKAVEGFVIGHGVSFLTGYLNDDNSFYGTVAYSYPGLTEITHCSILPIQQLSDFVKLSKMSPEQQEKYIRRKTVPQFRDGGANAVVACGNDLHREHKAHDGKHPFSFVKILKEAENGKVKAGREVMSTGDPRRQRREVAPPPGPSPPEENVTEVASAPLPPAPLPNVGVPDDGGPTPAPKATPEEIKASKTMAKLLRTDKHGTYYATVCYIVDANYLEQRFNGTPEEATLLLGGFVEMADWILRSTDWNMDGTPDNIGVRLFEVDIQYLTREIKAPDEKWGRAEGGSFMRRSEVFNKIRQIGTHLHSECDIRSGIGEINVAKYVLHEPGGCTACKHHALTSFVNTYVERYSPNGELLRMMYHQIRILTFGLVHTDSFCASCMGGSKGSLDNSDLDWGPCIVEAEVGAEAQSPSSIPLNTFRLGVCSRESGVSCLKELVARNNCLQFEPEESYCGNGIIEGDEECDCGTLASCAEKECLCSPRSGRYPCRKLSEEDSYNCFTLIRCRGFRFLHELGQSSGAHFLEAFNMFVDGKANPNIRGRSSDLGGGNGQQLTWGHFLIIQALHLIIHALLLFN